MQADAQRRLIRTVRRRQQRHCCIAGAIGVLAATEGADVGQWIAEGLTLGELAAVEDADAAEMDGILGFQILVLFRLSLDYRNGLVNFDYVLDRSSK